MSYKPGYKFCVQSTRDPQNKEVKHKLFGARFKDRTKDNSTFICELNDNTEVEVLTYKDGAVRVKVSGNEIEGYLG